VKGAAQGEVPQGSEYRSEAQGRIDIAQLALLFDERGRVDGTGRVKHESVRLPFRDLCAFVLRTAAEHLGINAAEFFSDNGWERLQQVLAIRNRITHPKKVEDLNVSDEEMLFMREANCWFFNCLAIIGDVPPKR